VNSDATDGRSSLWIGNSRNLQTTVYSVGDRITGSLGDPIESRSSRCQPWSILMLCNFIHVDVGVVL